jgi:hypothetical protein
MMISVPVCPFCGCELRLQKAFGGYAYGGNHADDCYVGMVKIFDSEKAAYAAAMKRVEPESAKGKWNLCDTCAHNFAECPSSKIVFGDGVGNDNVLSCDAWEKRSPIQKPLTLGDVNYNRTWHCWLRKPTDEERANAPWEEQSDD